MRTPSAFFSAAALTGALWTAAAPGADAPLGRFTGIDTAASPPAVVQAMAADLNVSGGHCSVVGAVQHPGTYRSTGGTVLLRTLIDQAGGLSPGSSGIVRILHDGRQQIVNLAVSPGTEVVPQESVIVADSAAATASDGRAFVDIACMQLCDRPVVLCLKSSDATLPRLLNLLGQPQELATAVRVVVPSGHQATVDLNLPSGTVVLFNPATVDRTSLADIVSRSPFNDLVELQLVEHQQIADETVEQLESLEAFLKAGVAAPATDRASVAGVSTSPLTAPLPATPAVPSSLAEALAAPEPVEAGAPETLQVRPVSALQLKNVSGPAVRPEEDFTAEDYLRAKQRAIAARAAHDSLATSDEIVPSAIGDGQSRWLHVGTSIAAWLLCAFAAYGAFGVWMRQHGRRREAVRQAAKVELPTPAPVVESQSALSQLIDNSLPLREEDTPAPSQIFHGRTVGFRYLIRSGPHPLQGPHFAAARVAAPSEPFPAETGVPRPAVRTSTTDRTTKRFDRAVEAQRSPRSARPGATAAAVAQHAPHTVTPMERALRSLLREQSEGRT